MLVPSPFDLNDTLAYDTWKAKKLRSLEAKDTYFVVYIENLAAISPDEKAALARVVAAHNWVIYKTSAEMPLDRAILRCFGEQLGLSYLDHNIQSEDDGVTALRVVAGDRYIPYTSRAIQWHSDGYYNAPAQTIFGMILHCVMPAAAGGQNAFVDHEQVYMYLRDLNPDFIRALSAPDVMTIPANVVDGREVRAAQSGAVFSVSPRGHLHIRYTARLRNIIWAADDLTQAAVAALQDFLAGDHPAIVRKTLAAGEGLLCRNVLHNRAGFEDDPAVPRLLYRLRYFDEIVL